MGIENGGLGQNLVNPLHDCADGRDWDLEFEKSPARSWPVEASNTAKAGAIFLGENQFYAATGVDIPRTDVMYRRLAYATELLQCCTACLTIIHDDARCAWQFGLDSNAKSSPAKMVDVSATLANEGTLCQYCDTLAQGTCYHCGAGACPRHSVLGVMVGLYVRGRLCNHCFRRIGEVCSDDDVSSRDEALGIQEGRPSERGLAEIATGDPEGKGCSPCPVCSSPCLGFSTHCARVGGTDMEWCSCNNGHEWRDAPGSSRQEQRGASARNEGSDSIPLPEAGAAHEQRDNYHEAEERDAGAATTLDPRESTPQRRCQCPRRCMVPVFGTDTVCDFCFTETDPQPPCGCDCIGFDCCGTEGPAEDWPASRTPLPQGSRRVLRVEHF